MARKVLKKNVSTTRMDSFLGFRTRESAWYDCSVRYSYPKKCFSFTVHLLFPFTPTPSLWCVLDHKTVICTRVQRKPCGFQWLYFCICPTQVRSATRVFTSHLSQWYNPGRGGHRFTFRIVYSARCVLFNDNIRVTYVYSSKTEPYVNLKTFAINRLNVIRLTTLVGLEKTRGRYVSRSKAVMNWSSIARTWFDMCTRNAFGAARFLS